MTDHQDPTTPARSDLRVALEESRRKRRTGVLVSLGILVAGALVGGGISIGSALRSPDPATAATSDEGKPISVKIAGSGETDFQDEIKDVAAEQGLDIEWVNFDDWTLPNSALVAGEVDANAFQHIAFLSAYNTSNDADLTPIFSTVLSQWGIFSATLDDTDSLPDGGRVAVPDDPSNGGRALFILQAAGLIELSDDAGSYPTVDDIISNERNLEFVPIAATTIPTQFDDPSLDAVVVGTSYFEPTQGVTAKDALFLDDELADASLPYVNVVATRADNADDAAWDILADVYADPRVASALKDETFGTTSLIDIPIDDLRTKLAELEDLARELG